MLWFLLSDRVMIKNMGKGRCCHRLQIRQIYLQQNTGFFMKQRQRMKISYVAEPQIDKRYVCRLMQQNKANKKNTRKIPECFFKNELSFIKKRLNKISID